MNCFCKLLTSTKFLSYDAIFILSLTDRQTHVRTHTHTRAHAHTHTITHYFDSLKKHLCYLSSAYLSIQFSNCSFLCLVGPKSLQTFYKSLLSSGIKVCSWVPSNAKVCLKVVHYGCGAGQSIEDDFLSSRQILVQHLYQVVVEVGEICSETQGYINLDEEEKSKKKATYKLYLQ